MKNYLLFFNLLFFSVTSLSANSSSGYEIIFKSEKFTPKVTTNFGKAIIPQSTEKNQGFIYRLIQFYTIPNNAEKQLIKHAGIELLSYIPNKAFIAKIQKNVSALHFEGLNIRSLLTIEGRFKLSPELTKSELPEWAIRGNDIMLNVKYYSKTDKESLIESITMKNGKVTFQLEKINMLTIQYSIDGINDLAKNQLIKWIEPITPLATPDGKDSKNTFRTNTLNTSYNGGRKYDGSGIVVALSDVGMIGPHIDTKGRVTQHTDIEDGDHSDMTSGILIGAGNLNPTMGGVAPGSDIHIYKHIPNSSIESHQHIVNAVENMETYGTVVTSTSYSQGSGGVYTLSSEFGDQQLYENQNIIHVFSAGNAGTSDHGYGAGAGWGNITGGYKAGKNVICVGNVDEDDVIVYNSGRGPAADGRIKPDMCAQGNGTWTTDKNNTYQVGGGTSAAAPAISGVVTQLYQAYKENNGGVEPETGLLKAALMNTAKDLGNPGPDYKYGWGRINALKAVRIIEDKRYIRNNIEQGENKSHNITVPSNVSEVRIMTYWTDVKGSPSSGIGLVNDIDMEVVTPSNATHNPWVLDPTPNATNLDADAVEGIDHLNNVEQVTIENPQAGIYTVNLSGYAIPEGPQTYYVLYDFIYEGVELTYPIGGEGFVPGESEWIRWDASAGSGDFELEYSINGGNSYISISDEISSTAPGYEWTVPNILSNDIRLKISRGSYSSESDKTLTIADVPQNIEILRICPESIKIGWDEIDQASAYEISVLGEKYMDIVGITNTNTFEVTGLDPDEEHWFSVCALVSRGKGRTGKGRRAIAIKKASGTPTDSNCPLPGLASNTKVHPNNPTTDYLNIQLSGIDDLQRIASNVKVFPNPTTDHFNIQFPSQLSNQKVGIKLVDVFGQSVLELDNKSTAENLLIGHSQIINGVYFIMISGENFKLVRKLIKQ
ncbi:S8 family serine peptidase [Flavivirga jejuensis]|uniref:S8 family serine peptidase n=1 Tax=Flavivirga jejuensis TaxID=870487 RepID=A0ABT8WWH1_9FLAO|nr:S8 family serine peptidase [Flavivirga jejuensis]MDO5977202.1 S8 family serine peptidase [Flavivirga jejuensis]